MMIFFEKNDDEEWCDGNGEVELLFEKDGKEMVMKVNIFLLSNDHNFWVMTVKFKKVKLFWYLIYHNLRVIFF